MSEQDGQLIWRKTGWYGRWYAIVDGERVRICRALGTDNKAVARRKLERLIAAGAPTAADVEAAETVGQYAEAWLKAREGRGLRSVEYERRHWKQTWKAEIGDMPLAAVKAQHIRDVLDSVAAGRIAGPRSERYSRGTLVHIRDTVLRLFDSAWRDEVIPENPVKRVVVPDVADERQEKARCILTDEEFGMLMQCAAADTEIKLMALLARTVGGMRAGDLTAMTWENFDPGFVTCTFVRRKTRRKNKRAQPLEVPEPVRPFLAAWWESHERPTVGPVFPARKGKRAGQAKKASNVFAGRLRRDLLKAGVDRHELHNETATTLPADFHSCRRAFATALARVGVNEQTAMILTGHSDAKVHRRYLNDMNLRALPPAAVPLLEPAWALSVPTVEPLEIESGLFLGGRSRDRTCDFDRVKPEAASFPALPAPLESRSETGDEPGGEGTTTKCPPPSARSQQRPTPVCSRLPVSERAELLALARAIRGALPPGGSRLRELVVELERRLEAAQEADGGAEVG